jgi:hypothetical protein
MTDSKYIPQGTAVRIAVLAILEAQDMSIAESIQFLLNYIAEHEGYAAYETSVTYMRKILDLVCERVEPSQAIL